MLAALVLLDGPKWLLIVLLALNAAAGAFFLPARAAAIPQLVPEGDLAAANAAENGMSQISWFVGPALGALLLLAVSPGVVLGIEAVTFALEALMITRVGPLPVSKDAVADDQAVGMLAQTWRDVREGGSYVLADRGLGALVVINAAAYFAFGAEQVLYVLVSDERLGLGAEGYGYLLAAMGVGGIVAAPLSARAGDSARAGRWLLGSGLLVGLPMVIVSFVAIPAVVFPLAVVEGAAAVVFDVVALTLLQRATAEAAMGRVFSLGDATGSAAQTLGSVGAPVLVALAGLGISLKVSGGLVALVVILAAPAIVALVARTDAERKRLRSITAELAGVPALAAFEPVDLERLGRAARTLTVAARTPVIVAGDQPDDLYVVRSGELSVQPEGAAVGSAQPPNLVAGDLFGEIGLLRGVPRTASVTAVTESELLVVEGSAFQAVAVPGPRIELVLGGMRTRLRRTHPQLLEGVEA